MSEYLKQLDADGICLNYCLYQCSCRYFPDAIPLTEKTDFIISAIVQKKKKIDGMLKYELQPSMSVVGVEKFTSAEEPAVTKTFYNMFS